MSFVAILKIGGLRARLVCLGFQSWFWFISYCWNRVTGWSMKDRLTHFWIFPLWMFWQQQVWFSTLVMRVRFHTSPEARMVWSNFFFPRCQIFPMFCWWHRWANGLFKKLDSLSAHTWSPARNGKSKKVFQSLHYITKYQSVIHSQSNADKILLVRTN